MLPGLEDHLVRGLVVEFWYRVQLERGFDFSSVASPGHAPKRLCYRSLAQMTHMYGSWLERIAQTALW